MRFAVDPQNGSVYCAEGLITAQKNQVVNQLWNFAYLSLLCLCYALL